MPAERAADVEPDEGRVIPGVDLRWPEGYARGDANRRALLVLASLRAITPRRMLELAQRKRTAAGCLAVVRAGRAGSEGDRTAAGSLDAVGIEAAVSACEARMIAVGDPDYPPGLEDLTDPPMAVFVRGRLPPPERPAVAVVGARNCSPLGLEVARDIGRGLAAAGVVVVSGAARGIDTAAHLGALDVGGPTVAVLGCGIDVAYPPGNRAVIDRIAALGGVVSEYPPGVPAEPHRFPARNRIVAGLAGAVVVVEGAAGSGSLITADHALDLGRSVYAVPGPVTSPLAEAPLALIRDGGTLIRGAEDLLADLGLAEPAGPDHGGGGAAPIAGSMSEDHAAVLAALAGPTLPETVSAKLGWELGRAVGVLVDLEMLGLVRSVGGRFERRLGAAR